MTPAIASRNSCSPMIHRTQYAAKFMSSSMSFFCFSWQIPEQQQSVVLEAICHSYQGQDTQVSSHVSAAQTGQSRTQCTQHPVHAATANKLHSPERHAKKDCMTQGLCDSLDLGTKIRCTHTTLGCTSSWTETLTQFVRQQRSRHLSQSETHTQGKHLMQAASAVCLCIMSCSPDCRAQSTSV